MQLHILVVEDNLVNQKVLANQLRKEGHTVHVANHGKEALDFIRRSVWWTDMCLKCGTTRLLSVILLDMEMPVMDGLTCVKKIREYQTEGEIRGHLPVIGVTANARDDQLVKCLKAGMVGLSIFTKIITKFE